MIDLDMWLNVNNPIEGATWTLSGAQAINDKGWVTGWGRYNDGMESGGRAFLLDASSFIPEPQSLLIVVAACALTALRRRSS